MEILEWIDCFDRHVFLLHFNEQAEDLHPIVPLYFRSDVQLHHAFKGLHHEGKMPWTTALITTLLEYLDLEETMDRDQPVRISIFLLAINCDVTLSVDNTKVLLVEWLAVVQFFVFDFLYSVSFELEAVYKQVS